MLGLSNIHVSDLLNGRRNFGPKALAELGFKVAKRHKPRPGWQSNKEFWFAEGPGLRRADINRPEDVRAVTEHLMHEQLRRQSATGNPNRRALSPSPRRRK